MHEDEDEETEETFQIKRSSRWQSFFQKGVLKNFA